jgi:FAD:protein FMN transferase
MKRHRALGALLAMTACQTALSVEASYIELAGRTMGTAWSVRIPASQVAVPAAESKREIQRLLDSLDQTFSTYRTNSEISRFNAAASTNWFAVSEEMADVMGQALRVAGLTDGIFDPTVGPLVELWGFGPNRHSRVPTAGDVAKARTRVGWRKLELRAQPPALRKMQPDVAIDLSGIAKGYAVDKVVELLQSRGLTNALVQVGGDTFALGHRSEGKGWRVGIEQPLEQGGGVQDIVELSGRALSTSGDYRNFHEINDRRHAHIIDPRTGWPVPHKGASASVVARTVAEADALATALFVLGPERGLALAERQRLSCLFVERAGERFTGLPSKAFTSMAGKSLATP